MLHHSSLTHLTFTVSQEGIKMPPVIDLDFERLQGSLWCSHNKTA
jgi:hypothetical protein